MAITSWPAASGRANRRVIGPSATATIVASSMPTNAPRAIAPTSHERRGGFIHGQRYQCDGQQGCTGATVDASGNVYAAAQEENLVEVYNPSGMLIDTIGPSNLNGPYDVAIHGTTLYVTDLNSSQVSEFNISKPTQATFLGAWS